MSGTKAGNAVIDYPWYSRPRLAQHNSEITISLSRYVDPQLLGWPTSPTEDKKMERCFVLYYVICHDMY